MSAKKDSKERSSTGVPNQPIVKTSSTGPIVSENISANGNQSPVMCENNKAGVGDQVADNKHCVTCNEQYSAPG